MSSAESAGLARHALAFGSVVDATRAFKKCPSHCLGDHTRRLVV
jgi:hypothetical protein